MRERGHDFSEEGGLHKFRTEIPNTVIRGMKSRGLTVHAKWLYVYFKSVCGDGTECYRTTSTIAEESGLSRTMVSTAKRELAAKGLIVLTKSKNPNRQADHVRIKNIWDENMQEFSVPLANALHEEENKEPQEEEAISVPLANAEMGQRSISERSVPLANSSVLLANQRRSLEEDPFKKQDLSLLPPNSAQPWKEGGIGLEDNLAVSLRTPPVGWREKAQAVLNYLNKATGRDYKTHGNIATCITNGATVEECCLVIDWWKGCWSAENPKQARYLNPDTPFKAGKFDIYRADAKQWQEQGRPAPTTVSPQHRPEGHTKTIDRECRTVRAGVELAEEISGGATRERPLLQSPHDAGDHV